MKKIEKLQDIPIYDKQYPEDEPSIVGYKQPDLSTAIHKINELVDIINSMNSPITCKTRIKTTSDIEAEYRYKKALEEAMGYLSRCLMCDEFERFDLEIKNILKGEKI